MIFLETSKFNIENTIRLLNLMLFLVTIFGASYYIYLINDSIVNTVTREQNDEATSLVLAEISSLENNYISLKTKLNIDMAYSLGFKDDFSRVHFSSESDNLSQKLSLLRDEI